MEPLISHTGKAVALRRDNVDTDQIVPGEFCKRVVKSGYADALFARWRTQPGFVLNRLASKDASVLLAGANFGVGSSREHAVWALRDGGFTAVAAAGFGDTFRRNAWNNALIPVDLPGPVIRELMDLAESPNGLTVVVDIRGRELRADGRSWTFPVDNRSRRLLLEGLDVIEATLRRMDRIDEYERGRPAWLPRVRQGELQARAAASAASTTNRSDGPGAPGSPAAMRARIAAGLPAWCTGGCD
ncbi:3-isopropylmalate dehydratase small subunit [Streptomyces sp. NBC_01092]|uniref:3-isopropylmalate dehydratase small subunit n=1 Tax=Streptomyces sp. NBC_01092 TaxID=2903748 RepID=UPI0038692A7F|nr:3-isopropylmalate dehydratase small subunit [Streptomyces sp. NBC_01092]